MKVVFTRKTEIGLTAIGDYIAEGSPRRAASFVRELREKAKAIARTPLASPLVPGFEDSGVRRRPYRNYLIFYVPRIDHILIIHIAHGARDYETDSSLLGDA